MACVPICRVLVFDPPPQVREQVDQTDQLSHLQSTGWQGGEWQPLVSTMGSKHPSPAGNRNCDTLRNRICWPTPHFESHRPQSVQAVSMQFPKLSGWQGLQEPLLQPLICLREDGHGVPPPSAGLRTSLYLCWCPKPQVWSHVSQSLHAAISHACASQGATSPRAVLQPFAMESVCNSLRRNRWCCLQLLQSSQGPSLHQSVS
mmetsp:Transcript_3428/g.6143  ORF Transcript_3428/g.6143 Transcript_3428/m.6143 type:complete len:203 (-) Transcript_3428:771-1379(-)